MFCETTVHALSITLTKTAIFHLQLTHQQESVVFGTLLDGLLNLMSSEYGFIGEVKYEEAKTMYLQTHAITGTIIIVIID